MNKVSALALLSNAVLVWNTVRIADIVRALKTASGEPVSPADIARVSPLAHAHVIPMHQKTDVTSRRYIAEEQLTFRDMPRAADGELRDTAALLAAALAGR